MVLLVGVKVFIGFVSINDCGLKGVECFNWCSFYGDLEVCYDEWMKVVGGGWIDRGFWVL